MTPPFEVYFKNYSWFIQLNCTTQSKRAYAAADSFEMACLNTLKLEIKTLEKIFTKNHERFQILNSSVDELTCRFIGKNGKRYDIHANITVSIDNPISDTNYKGFSKLIVYVETLP